MRDQERFSAHAGERRRSPRRGTPTRVAAGLLVAGVLASGCAGDAGSSAGGTPTIVATTAILGDVVRNLVGDAAEVEVVVPDGADPHDFQPSARQAAALREADLVVANGGGFEAGLTDTLQGAEDDGVTVFEALDHVAPLGGDPDGDDDTDGAVDPHFFTDPARMADAAEALAGVLATAATGLDGDAASDRAAAYVAELRRLDAEVETTLATVPADRRKLVTNHDVFAYFADRYGFEVIGTVIPGTTTQAAPSAAALDDLAAAVADAGVPAVFADTSSPDDLAAALADEVGDEVGDVAVVELYSESLGEPGSGADTYAGMVRTNADRIAGALAG